MRTYLENRFYFRGWSWLGIANTILAFICNRVLMVIKNDADEIVAWSIRRGTDFPPQTVVGRILLYYDGPALFTAQRGWGNYVCTLVGVEGKGNTYLCARASRNTIRLLSSGKKDLREVFLNTDLFVSTTNDPNRMKLISLDKAPEDWLPDRGLFL